MDNIRFAREVALKAKERIEAGEPAEEVFSDLRMSKENVEKELSKDEQIRYIQHEKCIVKYSIYGKQDEVIIYINPIMSEEDKVKEIEQILWEEIKKKIEIEVYKA